MFGSYATFTTTCVLLFFSFLCTPLVPCESTEIYNSAWSTNKVVLNLFKVLGDLFLKVKNDALLKFSFADF